MAVPALARELSGEVEFGSQTALLLWTEPPQELPRRNGAESADGAAEVTRDVRVEQPVPEESDEIARQQHDDERDQQSLPIGHGTPPRSLPSGLVIFAFFLPHAAASRGFAFDPARALTRPDVAGRAPHHAVSITGSPPMSRASRRSRTNTRSPASALKPLSKRNSNRPRSTTIGVFGSTPVVEAETR